MNYSDMLINAGRQLIAIYSNNSKRLVEVNDVIRSPNLFSMH